MNVNGFAKNKKMNENTEINVPVLSPVISCVVGVGLDEKRPRSAAIPTAAIPRIKKTTI